MSKNNFDSLTIKSSFHYILFSIIYMQIESTSYLPQCRSRQSWVCSSWGWLDGRWHVWLPSPGQAWRPCRGQTWGCHWPAEMKRNWRLEKKLKRDSLSEENGAGYKIEEINLFTNWNVLLIYKLRAMPILAVHDKNYSLINTIIILLIYLIIWDINDLFYKCISIKEKFSFCIIQAYNNKFQ